MSRNTFTLIKLFAPPNEGSFCLAKMTNVPARTPTEKNFTASRKQVIVFICASTSSDWQPLLHYPSISLALGPFLPLARTHSVPEVFVHLPGKQIYGIAFSCSSLLLLHIWNVHNNSHSLGGGIGKECRLGGGRLGGPRTNLRQKVKS